MGSPVVAQRRRPDRYVRGGVSPVGDEKYPFYLDESAREHERIAVSAGGRGCQMLPAPGDLLKVTGGSYAHMTMG